jgi:D-glycerate 3-kinase
VSEIADRLLQSLLERLPGTPNRPFVYGICGAQGSGKSTVAEILRTRLAAAGVRAAMLSIDDLYLSRAARAVLAQEVHPLLQTRGPPGTHDLGLGWAVLEAASKPIDFRLPRFDKAEDEPFNRETWPLVRGPLDVLLLEGWCVGAAPEAPQRLVQPINDLERDEDPDGRWRLWVNEQLGNTYQRLFARIDMLALIAAPSLVVIEDWRREQERQLRRALAERGRPTDRTLSDGAVHRFVQHFERITRHVLEEMPERADLVVHLDNDRRLLDVGAALPPRTVR